MGLKKKVESLTRIVQALIKEVQTNANLAQGTLTAFQPVSYTHLTLPTIA